jgi:diketogulonate reductase-like aldo/keto reductase
MYGEGGAERVVGQALAEAFRAGDVRREDVFVVSKVYPHNASRSGTLAACDRSRQRLQLETIDLYLLHWRGGVPLPETVAAFETLRDRKEIGRWGVSNFDVDDLEEAHAIAGDGRIACNQVLYHLKERAIEHAVVPWCERHDVAVVGYSPFGSGDFPGPRSAGGRVLQEIADAHGATPRQVALAFLARTPPLFAIPKAGDPDHAAENAGAGDLALSQREIARVHSAFPLGRPPHALPML